MAIDKLTAPLTDHRDFRLIRLSLVRRFIGGKPTAREARALDNVALLLTRVQIAARDISSTPDMLAKLNSAAFHAQKMLIEIARDRRLTSRSSTPPLDVMLSRARERERARA